MPQSSFKQGMTVLAYRPPSWLFDYNRQLTFYCYDSQKSLFFWITKKIYSKSGQFYIAHVVRLQPSAVAAVFIFENETLFRNSIKLFYLRQAKRLRIEYFRSILRQDIAFHDMTTSGELNARLSR